MIAWSGCFHAPLCPMSGLRGLLQPVILLANSPGALQAQDSACIGASSCPDSGRSAADGHSPAVSTRGRSHLSIAPVSPSSFEIGCRSEAAPSTLRAKSPAFTQHLVAARVAPSGGPSSGQISWLRAWRIRSAPNALRYVPVSGRTLTRGSSPMDQGYLPGAVEELKNGSGRGARVVARSPGFACEMTDHGPREER